jgi:hypothetical protein
MSRHIRRSCLLVALLATAIIPLGASVAGAQQLSPITINVRKVVSGTATTGSSVTLSCLTESVTFNFDATGAPTTADAGGANVAIVDGAWQLTGGADSSPLQCTLNETATGGASSTSWSCDYTNEPIEAAPGAEQVIESGCAAASGTGSGPVGLTLASFLEVNSQTADVTFTNTYVPLTPIEPITPAPQVVVQPAFTG